MGIFSPGEFFELEGFEHGALFEGVEHVWEVLPKIEAYIRRVIKPGIRGEVMAGVTLIGEVFIGEGTVVESGAFIRGPCIIGRECEVRQGAYIRGSVLVGDRCVIGHATEVKNSIFFNLANAPHFNYVGDSVLGNGVNLGAGTKLSNFKITMDKTIKLNVEGETFDTGLTKFGAVLGDSVQIGCNAVLNPGTVVGRGTQIYACAQVRGYIPGGRVVKLRQELEQASLRG